MALLSSRLKYHQLHDIMQFIEEKIHGRVTIESKSLLHASVDCLNFLTSGLGVRKCISAAVVVATHYLLYCLSSCVNIRNYLLHQLCIALSLCTLHSAIDSNTG